MSIINRQRIWKEIEVLLEEYNADLPNNIDAIKEGRIKEILSEYFDIHREKGQKKPS